MAIGLGKDQFQRGVASTSHVKELEEGSRGQEELVNSTEPTHCLKTRRIQRLGQVVFQRYKYSHEGEEKCNRTSQSAAVGVLVHDDTTTRCGATTPGRRAGMKMRTDRAPISRRASTSYRD